MPIIPSPNNYRPRNFVVNSPKIRIPNTVIKKVVATKLVARRPMVKMPIIYKPVKVNKIINKPINKPISATINKNNIKTTIKKRSNPIIRKVSVPATRQPRNVRKPDRSIARVRHDQMLQPHIDKLRKIQGKGVGRILVIVACGPSINEIDTAVLKNKQLIDIMAINRPDNRIWPTTYWSFCDQTQYIRNKELFETYNNGTIFNSSSIRVQHKNQILIRNRSGKGFSRDLTNGYYIGRSTTYASMQIALWMGYNFIYILGCDMSKVGDKLHYYGKNLDVDDYNRVQRFNAEAQHYAIGAEALTEPERKRFYFCSNYNKYPFIDKFNRLDQKDAVNHILLYEQNLLNKRS